MAEPIELTGPAVPARLDVFLAGQLPTLTRSAAQGLIESGAVLLGGRPARKNAKVGPGDTVTAVIPDLREPDILPEDIPLAVVYEDDCLLVVDKPKGMVVHPAPGHYTGTLVNALMFRCGDALSGINGVRRPGILHRIDKDTSGLLVVAKTDEAHQALAERIANHDFHRVYRAVLVGHLKTTEGTVSVPIGRSPRDRKKQAVNGLNAREAVTHYQITEEYPGFSLARFTLETGRTHQIRVHAAYLGHPVAGDAVYGDPKHTYGLDGQCLHAAELGFIHPKTGEYMQFESPLPDYFTAFLKRIRA